VLAVVYQAAILMAQYTSGKYEFALRLLILLPTGIVLTVTLSLKENAK